jgi:gliding motility-associated protein GldC
MDSSEIVLRVVRSGDAVEAITWRADEGPGPGEQAAKAFVLALWDADARNALRIDLWTKDMSVDDMNDFFFQTLMTMADTYANATTFQPLAGEIKVFAQEFAEKAARASRRSMGQDASAS